MRGLIARLFRRKVAPVEEQVRPDRATRRLLARSKPSEQNQKRLESAIRKAQRKRDRGYKSAHVRKREIYAAGVQKGIDLTVMAMKNQLTKSRKKKWLPAIAARLHAA